MNSIIISSFSLVLLCYLSDNSVSSSAISQLEIPSKTSSQPSIIANTNNDAPTKTAYSNTILHQSISTQDTYVKASPLSVAAVCNDGIVMISLHYNVDIDDEEDIETSSATTVNEDKEDNTELASEKAQEILDIISNDDNAYTALVEKKSIDQQQKQQQHVTNRVFRDLPLSTRGPLRIEPIYEMSTSSRGRGEPPPMALLTAGWRTDGITLCDAARELVSEEVRLYCLPSLVGISNDDEKDTSKKDCGRDNTKLIESKHSTLDVVVKKDGTVIDDTIITQKHHQQQPSSNSYYGRRIAEGLSYYLAKCSFSEGIRSLSTIGLLACGTTNGGSGGSLYLVDATGIHSVRAHAIGNGANNIHKRMVYVDFNAMDCHEGLRVLLRLIAEEGGLVSKTGSSEEENVQEDKVQDVKKSSIMAKPAFLTKRKNQKKDEKEVKSPSSQQSSSWNIPSNTAVELGIIKSGDRRMRRIRLSSLFS